MLGENIRGRRKEKGITQEELAIRLHVVRQTVSKWEKNLSVPDAEMLVQLAEQLDTTVDALLGAEIPKEADRNELAEQLARINEQLAIKNRRSKRIWIVVAAVLSVLILGTIGLTALGITNYHLKKTAFSSSITMVSEDPEYSEEEVEAAMDVVTKYFKKNFKGCELKSLSYDEDYSSLQEKDWIEQYQADEAIVLSSEFTTDSRGGDGSLDPDSTYKGWDWVLTRTAVGKWILQTWGYA